MRAKRSLGQNFLVAERFVHRIIKAAKLGDGATVLEIGPGRGALTRHLLGTGAAVVAVEKDHDLALQLPQMLSGPLTVVTGDLLQLDPSSYLCDTPMIAVGNLPYNISVPILFHLIGLGPRLSRMVLMFQREVAERLAAGPGSKKYGVPTVMAQLHTDIEHLFDVPPEAFRPQPKVWSSVVRVTPLPKPRIELPDPIAFRRLLNQLFQHRRKTIGRILRNLGYDHQGDAPLDLRRRPETLTLEELATLTSWLDGPSS